MERNIRGDQQSAESDCKSNSTPFGTRRYPFGQVKTAWNMQRSLSWPAVQLLLSLRTRLNTAVTRYLYHSNNIKAERLHCHLILIASIKIYCFLSFLTHTGTILTGCFSVHNCLSWLRHQSVEKWAASGHTEAAVFVFGEGRDASCCKRSNYSSNSVSAWSPDKMPAMTDWNEKINFPFLGKRLIVQLNKYQRGYY